MADEGASPRELLLEACRRDNTELLTEVLSTSSATQLLNTARDGIGNYCLHIAASYGSCQNSMRADAVHADPPDDVLDKLLDQEGLEVDPVDRMEGDTPLHKAVRYANGLDPSSWPAGKAMVELLLDAGADPRIRNKGKLKALELVNPQNTELRSTLQRAEMAQMGGDDIVQDDDDEDEGSSTSE